MNDSDSKMSQELAQKADKIQQQRSIATFSEGGDSRDKSPPVDAAKFLQEPHQNSGNIQQQLPIANISEAGYSSNTVIPVDTVKLVKQIYDEWIAAMEKRMMEERDRMEKRMMEEKESMKKSMMEEKEKMEKRMMEERERNDALQKNREELLIKNVEMQQKLKYLEDQSGITLSTKRIRSVKSPPFLPRILDFHKDLSLDHSFPGVLVEALPLWREAGLFNRSESTSQTNAETFFAEFCKILNCHLPEINFEAVSQPILYDDPANNLGKRKLDILITAKDVNGHLVNAPFTIELKNGRIDVENFEHQIYDYLKAQLTNNAPFLTFYGILTNGTVFWLYCLDFSNGIPCTLKRCEIK